MRNYLTHPRHAHEFDPEFRNDVNFEHEVSKTKQSDAEAADINNIMARYERTGLLPEMMQSDPSFGDFSDAPTFQEAHAVVAHASSQFMALDGKVREMFQHDPAKMLQYVQDAQKDPEKKKELYRLGLAIDPTPAPNPHVDLLKEIASNTKKTPKSTVSKE